MSVRGVPRRRARLAATLVAVAAAGTALAPAAWAHPLGAPQSARISAEGSRVMVSWSAPAGDLTALALHLGVLEESRRLVYEDGALVPAESDPGDGEVLASSPRFTDYLLAHVRVRQSGKRCDGAVTSTDDLAADGALLTFTCPGRVSRVRIGLTTLTDVHPAYRTLASSSGGDRATYTRDAGEHVWRLGGTGEPRWALAATAGAGVAAAASGAVVLLRRRRGSAE